MEKTGAPSRGRAGTRRSLRRECAMPLFTRGNREARSTAMAAADRGHNRPRSAITVLRRHGCPQARQCRLASAGHDVRPRGDGRTARATTADKGRPRHGHGEGARLRARRLGATCCQSGKQRKTARPSPLSALGKPWPDFATQAGATAAPHETRRDTRCRAHEHRNTQRCS